MPDRRRLPWAIALSFLFPCFLLLLQSHTYSHLGDPDRYYHFAVSRELVTHRALHLETLPQADSLEWQDYFPDKEFLFHVLTAAGYAVAGERGVELATLAAGTGVALTLFWFALGLLPALEAFACALAVFSTSFLAFRMLYVRPHVLATLLFVLLAAAIARKRILAAAVVSALFALAYHAIYVPLLCAGLAAVFACLERKSERERLFALAAATVGGCFVGVVVNPYFPSNLEMALLVAKIPFLMHGELRTASFGAELYPLAGPGILKFYYLPLATLLLALAARVFRDFPSRFLLSLVFVFGALAFQTTRAGEYFVSSTGLLLPLVIASFPRRKWIFGVAAAQLVVLFHLSRTEASFVPDGDLYDDTRAAIALIPPGAAKVFNCEWDLSPIVFDARPDLKFVDFLDPSLLYDVNPGLYRGRRELLEGRISDPRALVGYVFNSSYVLCRTPTVLNTLEADPGFERVFPAAGRLSRVSLYRVRPAPNPAFVHKVKLYLLSDKESLAARDFAPRAKGFRDIQIPDPLSVVGLRDAPRQGARCAQVRAAESEISSHRGAEYLGVGGGGAIRAWRNGRAIFSSGPEYARARSVQALVRLDPPLREKDVVDLLVCSGPSSQYWAATLSLWTAAAARDVCRGKAAAIGAFTRPPSSAPLSTDHDSCFGPLAEQAVPAGLRP